MLPFSNHDDRQMLWDGNDTMRLRRITARRSSVHDKGLFALQPLAAGERLIEYKGEVTSWRRAEGARMRRSFQRREMKNAVARNNAIGAPLDSRLLTVFDTACAQTRTKSCGNSTQVSSVEESTARVPSLFDPSGSAIKV
jgi:hypothetical protein